nr:immunoglobulin light chain junction region [Macaca mulatta]
CQHYDNTPYSF